MRIGREGVGFYVTVFRRCEADAWADPHVLFDLMKRWKQMRSTPTFAMVMKGGFAYLDVSAKACRCDC